MPSTSAHFVPSRVESRWRITRLLHSAVAEVWVKFLLSLLGLALAFAAALFSTVSRDAGNVWATVILASLALLLGRSWG